VASKPEKIMLRVDKGALVPADQFASKLLRERKYAIGDIVSAVITKPRNPGFWRLAHQLGTLVVENIEGFEGMDSHKAIKRLQREAMIECDEFVFNVPGCGMVTQYIPRSLSFESMSDELFHEVYQGICRWIVKTYWKDETPENIERMAGLMETV
jgi:hypothetical protein